MDELIIRPKNGDILRPFNFRNVFNRIRNTAYSRFKPIPFVSVNVMKDLLDTDIVNLNDLSKAIQSLNLVIT